MRHVLWIIALIVPALSPPVPVAAQTDLDHVYEMYYEIDFSDLPAWIEFYRTHEVPVLEALVEDGVLLNFGLWTHEAGGRFNVRYNLVAPNWDALGDYVDAYMERVDEGALGEVLAMVREHDDAIWTIRDSSFPDGWEAASMVYEAAYQIDLSTRDRWEAAAERYGVPALDRAVDEGRIEAWVLLQHHTGGPHDMKQIYWLEDWDAADDAIAFLGEARVELGMTPDEAPVMLRHRDDIWRPVARR